MFHLSNRIFIRFQLFFVFMLTILVSSGLAQEKKQAFQIPFPTDPNQWLNSSPLTQANLKGKGVVFWFYEESCPKCRDKWPAILQTSRDNANVPIIFIAVNSGNAKGAVRNYVKSTNIDWPVIIDTDRSFEKACKVKAISLQNINQSKILYANGKFRRGKLDMNLNATKAAKGATWNIDPATMPKELKKACRALEFGNYIKAGLVLKRSLKSSNEAVKEKASELIASVTSKINTDFKAVESLESNGEYWAAYQKARSIKPTYKGFSVPDEVTAKVTELKGHQTVMQERRADSIYRSAIKTGNKGGKTNHKKAIEKLEKIVANYSDTEAAKKAQAVLDKVKDTAAEGQ